MNEFVSYLNSINNVGGNSTGSLAESQVKSTYFEKVKVDRKLGHYIADSVRSENYKAFILTGHAGDGKTSILVQVLKELDYLGDCESLDEAKDYSNFYYVKDMSEVAEDKQVGILTKALSAPHSQKSSLLISNTGPLLNSFTALQKKYNEQKGIPFSEAEKIELQSTLLSQLDSNEDREIVLAGFSFMLINIARVDNVLFASKILEKILNDELWADCSNCPSAAKCPIYNNKITVSRQFKRVALFIENYYRFLYENDKRMTIRQMLGQISYALTGNLSCKEIDEKYLKEPFFNYNFANLFFGYHGIDEKKDARQIKGIEQIQTLELDKKALDVDYRLFVNQDYHFFLPDIQSVLHGLTKKYRKHYQIASSDSFVSSSEQKAELKLRRAVRRFYLFYSLCNSEEESNNLMNQVFGVNFTDYCKMITNKQPKPVLGKLQSTVFQALYMKNTGSLPYGQTELPLTLRREDDVFQNVMLVLGTVNKKSLEIVQEQIANSFEDFENKQRVVLKIGGDSFRLSLPLVNYFQGLIAGSIASNNNPALTHGISTLDAMLLDHFGDDSPESEDDCEMRVIINTTSGQDYENFSFSEGNLNVW